MRNAPENQLKAKSFPETKCLPGAKSKARPNIVVSLFQSVKDLDDSQYSIFNFQNYLRKASFLACMSYLLNNR